MKRYDADVAPDPSAWLALDPDRRRALVRAHHRGRVLRIHAKGDDPDLHASLHGVVEDQVACDDPPATRRTVLRLEAEGLRRHAAVHAVIEVLVRLIAGGESFDEERWERELAAIDAGGWLGERMRKDLGR